jgi:hypothetical protein
LYPKSVVKRALWNDWYVINYLEGATTKKTFRKRHNSLKIYCLFSVTYYISNIRQFKSLFQSL